MQYNPGTRSFSTFRNVVINGDQSICQINAVNTNTALNLAVSNFGYYNVDNSRVSFLTGGAMTAVINDSQRNDHPILGTQGYSKSIEVTGAQAAIANNHFFNTRVTVEGNLLRSIFSQQCILSFQVKSPKTGVHYVALQNSGQNVSFVQSYIVNQANTWEQKFISILFNPPGLWFFDESLGTQILFPLVAGTNFIAPSLGTWNAGNFQCGANQQNLFDTVGNTFRITDIQLELGFTATPFDRIPFDENYIRCQRYYWQTFLYGTPPSQAQGTANSARYRVAVAGIVTQGLTLVNPTTMNSAPNVTTFSTNLATANWYNITLAAGSGVPIIERDASKIYIGNPQLVGDAVNNRMAIHLSADSRL